MGGKEEVKCFDDDDHDGYDNDGEDNEEEEGERETGEPGDLEAAGECTCGAKKGNKIVGGAEASPGEWPWIVVFSFGAADGSQAGGCAGTLVADRWVVTAAHCV